jgi:hypothetical protein
MNATSYFWDKPEDFEKSGLTRAEWLIANMYFCEAMTLREIGATLSLSVGRVVQLHQKVISRFERRDDAPAGEAIDN